MNINKLKQMMKEPASKEWFAKHGSPKSKALHSGKIVLKQPRRLTEAEQKEKTKNWIKAPIKELSEKEKSDYQRRIGRAYND